MKRVIDWICSQNYTKSQLQNVTWAQLATIADNLDLDLENLGALKKKIKPYKNTIMNAIWSDWRKKKIESIRAVLESKVQEQDPDATVTYEGQSVPTQELQPPVDPDDPDEEPVYVAGPEYTTFLISTTINLEKI